MSTPVRRSARKARPARSFTPGETSFQDGIPRGLLTSPDAKLRRARSKSPARRTARDSKSSSKTTTTATATTAQTPPAPAPASPPISPLVAITVLAVWFLSSAVFNDCTPRLLSHVVAGGGSGVDVTIVELTITVLIASLSLAATGQRLVPPPAVRQGVVLTGTLHLVGCRLYLTSLAYVPVSLAQTIRAANPLFVVVLGALFLGQRYSDRRVLAVLVLIVFGFALAVSADAEIDPVGVAASVGSVICVVFVNALSKRLLTRAAKSTGQDGKGKGGGGGGSATAPPPTIAELQCW